MDRVQIGKRIKGFRKLKGYTQMDFAKKLRISLSLLGAVERGTKDIPDDLIDTIADTLDIDKEEILHK